MKFTAFSTIIVGLTVALCSANEQQELTKDNCMPFCADEIENIVFTTESLKSSMQTTINSLKSELIKIRTESDSKDVMIEKARSERSVWKSKADAIQTQMKDVRMQYSRKVEEVKHYRSFLDEKEKAKIDDDKAKKDGEEKENQDRYEKKLLLDAEQQQRKEDRKSKGLDPHDDDEDEDDGKHVKPEPGSKKYFQRVIENLEFTMESVLKSSHNCQHQLSQCLGKELHPLLEKAYAIENSLEAELDTFLTSRMSVNWCVLKSDISYMFSYVGLGSDDNKCLTTRDVKINGPKRSAQEAPIQLSPQMQAAQDQATKMGGFSF